MKMIWNFIKEIIQCIIAYFRKKEDTVKTESSVIVPMTEEEYIENNGEYCPNCRSEDIDTVDEIYSSTTYNVEMECNTCGCQWFEIYKLSGMEIIERK